jgi:ammonia channel protein AmtB
MERQKKIHRIILTATAGVVILALVWPVLGYGVYFTDPLNSIMGALTIVLFLAGALLVSYAAREIHPALAPSLWGILFLAFLVRFLAGNSDGPMEDLGIILMAGIPGVVLLYIGLRTYLRGRRRAG